MRAQACATLLVLAATLASCERRDARGTVVRWDAASGTMPGNTGNWDYGRGSPGPAPEFLDGVLSINTTAYGDMNDRSMFNSGSGLRMPAAFRMEARLRITEDMHDSFSTERCAGMAAALGTGRVLVFMVGSDALLLNEKQLPLPDDLRSKGEFHTYRVETNEEEGILYVDGVERGRAPLLHDPNATRPSIWWGENSRLSAGISEWAYVWHNAGEPRLPDPQR